MKIFRPNLYPNNLSKKNFKIFIFERRIIEILKNLQKFMCKENKKDKSNNNN